MTERRGFSWKQLLGLLTLCLLSGCAAPPEGDVLVLKAGDYVGIPDDPPVHEPMVAVVMPDTVGIILPDTIVIILPDTVFLPPPDSLSIPDDSTVTPPDSLPAPPPVIDSSLNLLAVEIRGSLYGSLRDARGISPDVLGAHCVRYLWWDMNPWTGFIAGDSLRILYSTEPGLRENTVAALQYIPVQGSSNRPFKVFVFKKTGDNYPSIWYPDGVEVVKLLNRMPLSTFEEITGIVGEVRGSGIHHGIDFKAPTGVPVRTVLGGRVNRVNWNESYNGRCVEIHSNGYREIFLHLDELSPGIRPGVSVEAGTQIGTVGNTGRSYASHLHYQINDPDDNPIDPYVFLGSRRRSLEGSDLVRFAAVRDSLDTLLRGF